MVGSKKDVFEPSMPATLFTWRLCPFCVRAKRLLEQKGIQYEEILVDRDPPGFEKMKRLSGQATVPQIWIGQKHIGGFTDLRAIDSSGELDALLLAAQ